MIQASLTQWWQFLKESNSLLITYKFKVQNSKFKVQSSKFKVQSSKFNVQSSNIKDQSSKFKIQSSKLITTSVGYPVLPGTISQFHCEIVPGRFSKDPEGFGFGWAPTNKISYTNPPQGETFVCWPPPNYLPLWVFQTGSLWGFFHRIGKIGQRPSAHNERNGYETGRFLATNA